LVRVMAASINLSEVKNVGGPVTQTALPRFSGSDFAGVVETVPAEWIGVKVWDTDSDTPAGVTFTLLR